MRDAEARERALAAARSCADYWRRTFGPDSNHVCVLDDALAAEQGRVRQLEARADYLQREVNLMRRVMQHYGTWDAFCVNYAEYERRRGVGAAPADETATT